MPVDRAAYDRAGRDPRAPIVSAGRLDARVCIVGRDLGREEVLHGQPLVGASGRLVRRGVLRALGLPEDPRDPLHGAALDHVLLCNLVPYKPIGNRAFPAAAREAFRPALEALLACRWTGEAVLALGREACDWFLPYLEGPPPGTGEGRFACEVPCRIAAPCGERRFVLCPLPHPSPANAAWRSRFPDLLARRLARWL